METPTLTCPPSPARDQPAPAPGPAGAPGGQASPSLTPGPVLLPPPALLLKALPVPLYHTVPPGVLQPRAPLLTGSLDGGSAPPFILGPLLQPEGSSPARGKQGAPTLTVNLVGALPVLSPGPALGSPGRARSAGRHLCPHCGRDCGKPSVLEKHIRSHTGERPFPCASCGVAFKTQSNLYKHRRTLTHLSHSRPAAGAQGRTQGPPPDTPQSLGPKSEAATLEDEEGPSLTGSQPRRKLPEQKPGPLLRAWEKAGDSRATEGRLRKCESTDSGYLSRSDSAEQPAVPGSPPPSGEAEGEAPAAPRGPSLALEKQQLEERIARLISHNQAVVADPQLEHVRPRRSLLGQLGSLDLAPPHGLRASFHLTPTRSALGPPDRSRPLFFHSVPTQLSTSTECVPVTRSNSLPAVEGTRTWPELPGPHRELLRRGPARLGGGLALTVVAVPSAHPRGLVRQAAVDDLPGPPAGDNLVPAEEPEGLRAVGGGGAASRGRGPKRTTSRKPRTSQEKWRVYSRDTFQKLYQKMSSGRPGARRTGDVSVHVQPGPWGTSPAPGTVLVAESSQGRDTVVRTGGSDPHGGLQATTSLPTLSCQEYPGVSQRGPLLAPRDAEPRREGSPGGCQNSGPLSGCPGGPRGAEGVPLETKKVKVAGQSGQERLGAGGRAPTPPLRSPQAEDAPRGGDTEPTQATPSSLTLSGSGPGSEEPPRGPEAARPEWGPQLAAPREAPSALAAPADTPFPPKYLLRLPQGAHGPGRDWCEGRPASMGSGPGTPPRPGPAPSGTGDKREGALQGEGTGGRGAPPTPAAGDGPREGGPFLPTPTWDPLGTKDAEGGPRGAPGRGRDCAGGRSRTPSRERGSSLGDGSGEAPSRTLEGRRVPCVAAPRAPLAQCSGTSGDCEAPFPSLRAEPRLTWCCLHRSLPLALEQGDTGASAYLALPVSGTGAQGRELSTLGGSRPGPGGQTQPRPCQLPGPPAQGVDPGAPGLDPKGCRPRGRIKRSRGNSQHRPSAAPKRYRGAFCAAQLRAGRLRKPHLLRRRERRGPCRALTQASCRRAGRSVQGEPAGNGEKPDSGDLLTSESSMPRPSSRTAMVTPEGAAPAAGELGDGAPQDTVGGSGSSLPAQPCVDSLSLLSRGKRLDLGPVEMPPDLEQGPRAAPPHASAETQGPGSSEPRSLPAAAPPCSHPEGEAREAPLGICGADLRDRGRDVGETLLGRAVTHSGSLFPGPLTPPGGPRGPSSAPGGSPRPNAQETAVSAHSPQEEGSHKHPPTGQLGQGAVRAPCAASGEARGEAQVSGSVGPLAPERPTDVREAPAKTLKRRSLEGVRRQTCVELSDSSSDDEGRLVIEL